MADRDKIEERYSYHFIHNVYAHFFHDTLQYFAAYLNPRFEYSVVGTYDKAVEYIRKTAQYERETDKPMLPALILNPTGEYRLSDMGGRQLYRFPNLAPGMISSIYQPIYMDKDVMVTVGFTRITGEIELIMLLNSFYEYCDMRMMMLQIFGGPDRYIYPRWFNSFIILPEELINYEYTNSVTNEQRRLNWESAGAWEQLVRSTARDELVVPCRILPWYKITSIADGSSRYGGADRLAEWRLNTTLEYEVELPSYMILESDWLTESVNMCIGYGSVYSAYPDFNVPVDECDKIEKVWDSGIDATAHTEIAFIDRGTRAGSVSTDDQKAEGYETPRPDQPTEGTACGSVHVSFKVRYHHIVTAAQADSTANWEITIPQTVNRDLIMVQSYEGKLTYGTHYYIKDDEVTMVVIAEATTFNQGDIIELYIYEYN